MKPNKKFRQRIILDVFKTYDQLTQEGIQQVLKDDYHIEVNRSTISRDLRELGIQKNKEKEVLELSQNEKLKDLKIQIFHLLSSSSSDSFYYNSDEKEDNLTMTVFYTDPSTAVAVAVLFEQLFEERYPSFVAIANHSGKIVLIFSIKHRQAILKEINTMMKGKLF